MKWATAPTLLTTLVACELPAFIEPNVVRHSFARSSGLVIPLAIESWGSAAFTPGSMLSPAPPAYGILSLPLSPNLTRSRNVHHAAIVAIQAILRFRQLAAVVLDSYRKSLLCSPSFD